MLVDWRYSCQRGVPIACEFKGGAKMPTARQDSRNQSYFCGRRGGQVVLVACARGPIMKRREFLQAASLGVATTAVVGTLAVLTHSAVAQSGQPIKIGFSMAMTGGLAANGKSALLAQKIWEEDVNAKGGLLGRPVKLVYYDDQSNPSTVPGIYTKLLDVDKV